MKFKLKTVVKMNIQRRKKFLFVIVLGMMTGIAIADDNNSEKKDALCDVYQGMLESGRTGFTQMPEFCPPVLPKYAFVTSVAYNGNLGGVAGADAKCQQLADSVKLPGVYQAWVATSPTDAPELRSTRSITPYIRVDGVPIADNWDDLVDGPLQNPLDIDENGLPSTHNYAWSNVSFRGEGVTSGTYHKGDSCYGWLQSSTYAYGRRGIVGSGSVSWSDYGGRIACFVKFPLYCFQQ